MKTYRWENRFLSFVFGIAEANAFSCYEIWGSYERSELYHSEFKSRLAFSLLQTVTQMREAEVVAQALPSPPVTRSRVFTLRHMYVTLSQGGGKRIRRVCRFCTKVPGVSLPKVGFRFACNLDPMCKICHQQHFSEEYTKDIIL